MKPLELAFKYMDAFFGNAPLESLGPLFAEQFSFEGPFYRFDSASGYIESLKSDPPVDVSFSLVHSYQTPSSACLIYLFHKHGLITPMAQSFDIKDGKISKILLVFDTAAFNQLPVKN